MVNEAVSGLGLMMTIAEPEAETVLLSVTENDSVLLPFAGSVTLKLPVPTYGVVPPTAETLQMNGSPAVRGTPSDPQETVTTNGWPDTTTLSEPEALTLLESLTVNDSVNVPLVGSVMVKLPVPEYGEVPPDAETMQLNGFPSVAGAEAAQVTVTDKGCGSTVTLAIASALTPFASVTVKVWVKLPLFGSVRLMSPVPPYGVVPPDSVTVHVNGLPAVMPDVGQEASM